MSRPSHRLITLAFSHYNEKARWALDHCGIAYEEERFMPGFSQLAVMAATRGRGGKADRVSTRYSTPVLFTRDGSVLSDSTDIARWASSQVGEGDGPLFPTPEVLDLVNAFGKDLGPYTRLVAYFHAFKSKTALPSMAKSNVGRGQALAFRALLPLGQRLIGRSLGVNAERCARALDRVRAQVTLAEERLARGPFLVGDTFTAADLTFASLLAPALLVTPEEGYAAVFPSLDELPPETNDLVTEMRATRGGKFALEMFRSHRAKVFGGAETAAGAGATTTTETTASMA